MEVPFCFINERSFVQPIDVKNTLRFLSLSVRLLAAALANSPLRGSNRAPQLQLAQTNFTKTCYHFCQSTVGRRICFLYVGKVEKYFASVTFIGVGILQRCRRFYQYCDKTIARLPKILFMLAATAELCLRLAEPS